MAFFGKNDNFCCKISIETALLLVRSRLPGFRRLPASGYMAKDAFRAPLIYPALGNGGVYYFNQTICAHRDECDVSGTKSWRPFDALHFADLLMDILSCGTFSIKPVVMRIVRFA